MIIKQGVVCLKKMSSFVLVLAIVVNSMFMVCFAANYRTVTINPGQSFEFSSKVSTGTSVIQKGNGKFDVASYNSDGSVDSAYCMEETYAYVPAGGRMVLTVPSSSKALSFEYDSDRITMKSSSSQALKKIEIQPGANYEFRNKNTKNEFVRQYGKEAYDYIEYEGVSKYAYTAVDTSGSVLLSSNGRSIVSVSKGSPAVTFYIANELFNRFITATEVSEPGVYKLDVKPGETYEFKNVSTEDKYLRAKNMELYDYIVYKEDGTPSYSDVSYYGGESISAGNKLVLTLLPTSLEETFYMPYEDYKSLTVSKLSNEALHKVDIEPGQSYEFTNNSSTEARIFASWHDYYETALYRKTGTPSIDDSSGGSQYIDVGERLIVTVPDYSEAITFSVGYDTYKNGLTIKQSTEPALHKIVVFPGFSYEFKNIGKDYAYIRQSGSDKYGYELYSDRGSLIDSSSSHSGSQSVSDGWKLKISVPEGSSAVAFYTGFETFKKCFDPNIKPKLGVFSIKQLDQAKDKKEVLKILESSYALVPEKGRTTDNVREQSVVLAEEAIKKISAETVKVTSDIVDIDSKLVKEQVKKAVESVPEIETVLEKSGIEKNREINTTIKINLDASSKKNMDLVINKNLSEDAKEVDNVYFDTGEVGISLDTSKLSEEFDAESKLLISVEEEEETVTAQQSVVLASNSEIKALNLAIGSTQQKKYTINFKNENGSQAKSLKNNVDLKFPAVSSEGDYNCVFKVEDGNTEAVGGLYNADTNTLSIKSKNSAQYYVVENKKSFDDIGSKDASMRKAIEIMAAKGIINGKDSGKFEPDSSINRSEFATLIVRAIYKYDSKAAAAFNDIEAKAWYYPFVASAKKEGIINGYPDNTFKPQNIINKQEIITICASVLNNEKGFYYPKEVDKFLDFADNSNIPEWARKFVALANREGIIIKRRDQKFVGEQPFTRGDAAVILYRLFNKL